MVSGCWLLGGFVLRATTDLVAALWSEVWHRWNRTSLRALVKVYLPDMAGGGLDGGRRRLRTKLRTDVCGLMSSGMLEWLL